MQNKKVVAVFGGTFDPPHLGHTALVQQLLKHKIANSTLFLPSPNPPHKTKQYKTSFLHRSEMLKLAISDIKYTDISLIENEIPNDLSYTYNTISTLTQKLPHTQLKLLIGGDSLLQLHTWYKAKQLVNEFEFIIYPRNGEPIKIEHLNSFWNTKEKHKLFTAQHPLPLHNISSTEVRRQIKLKNDVSALLHPKVLKYIEKHSLYR
jgi:nicotinate-nucleotide adenylyltransferase